MLFGDSGLESQFRRCEEPYPPREPRGRVAEPASARRFEREELPDCLVWDEASGGMGVPMGWLGRGKDPAFWEAGRKSPATFRGGQYYFILFHPSIYYLFFWPLARLLIIAG